ncbi:MAG: O-methyltransferase [Conexibacter sp.]|nr:O-methyltransferase [Conexibacter sp.]
MIDDRWTAVDRYVTDLLIGPDPLLDAALAAADAAGLPQIAVTPPQGKLLYLLARIHGARTILELGTLAGYSTIWLARALPAGGRLVTLEANPAYAEVARGNVAAAGLADRVEVRVGAALDTLPQLDAEGAGPFDLIFIDADKDRYPDYLSWAIRLARPGSLIVGDNVVRGGALADDAEDEPRALGARRFHELLAAEPRVEATTIQTVGEKGYDGFTLARVRD